MNLSILISTILLFYSKQIDGQNEHLAVEVLDILKNISGRIANIEAKVDGLVTLVNKLDQVYECGWPEIKNGHFEGNSTYFRSVMQTVCDDGFTRFGPYEVTCTSDGVWSEFPLCRRNCMSPGIRHSTEYNKNRTYIYGQQIRIECVYGYRKSVLTEKLECKSNYWSGFATCHPVDACLISDCGYPPRIAYGSYLGGVKTTFNNTLSLTCHEGYERIGSDYIRCNAYRKWDGEQECLQKLCVNVTSDDGRNVTECFYKQENSYYFSGNDSGSTANNDPTNCMHFCLTSHKLFSFIRWGPRKCYCVIKTGKEYVYRTTRNKDITYIRESEMDDIYKYSS